MSPPSRLRAILEERLALMAPARRLRLALAAGEVERRFGSGADIRVLDAGCGDGLLSLAMAKGHRSWSILGVDLRADLLEGARKRAGARRLANVGFVEGNLEQPLPESGVQAVLAVECLSEIPDDRRALQMMAAALAPGGLLVVQVPERDWQPVLPGSPGTWREQVRQGYTAAELEAALRGAGLTDVMVRPTYRSLAAGAQEIRDRIKDRGLLVRLAAFPLLALAVRLERLGVTFGQPNALLAVGARVTG
ncbi:MAG TPA: methyltransferase domain-containing protein [Solirubrobacterales bacterium]|nr:methyltransferase domain-containing protein [Solirubrobacterales bacterium]